MLCAHQKAVFLLSSPFTRLSTCARRAAIHRRVQPQTTPCSHSHTLLEIIDALPQYVVQ